MSILLKQNNNLSHWNPLMTIIQHFFAWWNGMEMNLLWYGYHFWSYCTYMFSLTSTTHLSVYYSFCVIAKDLSRMQLPKKWNASTNTSTLKVSLCSDKYTSFFFFFYQKICFSGRIKRIFYRSVPSHYHSLPLKYTYSYRWGEGGKSNVSMPSKNNFEKMQVNFDDNWK